MSGTGMSGRVSRNKKENKKGDTKGEQPLNKNEKKNEGKSSKVLDIPPVPSIDYIGNGSYNISQHFLLQRRSLEPIKDVEARLSARGLHHRPIENFERDVMLTTSTITNTMRTHKQEHGKDKLPPMQLYIPYFQRALAYERLGDVDRAITDYTTCLSMNKAHAPAWFNRSGLYFSQQKIDEALADINMAISLDPSNYGYRSNKVNILRAKGVFLEAVDEAILCRAIKLYPHISEDLAKGLDPTLDSAAMVQESLDLDPTLTAMMLPPEQKNEQTLEPVINFLKTVKLFAPHVKNNKVLSEIAKMLELRTFQKGEFIFEEGDVGTHFFIILEGEVSIVKCLKDPYDNTRILSTNILVKMYRGASFGEAALESKFGLRSAGSMAMTATKVLCLESDDYNRSMTDYKALLQVEVEKCLRLSPVFKDIDKKKLRHLSSFAVVRNYGPNATIVNAGDPSKHLYVIKVGVVKVIKSMNRPNVKDLQHEVSINNEGVPTDSPGMWVLGRNWKSTLESETFTNTDNKVDFNVGILGSGQAFNELAVLDPDIPSPVTVKAYTSCELYMIESDILIALGMRFNTSGMASLNESFSMLNPSSLKYEHYFRQRYRWEKEKLRVLKQLTKGMKRPVLSTDKSPVKMISMK